MPRKNWHSVVVPDELIKVVDQIVAENKYPLGKYRSRNDFIVQAVKEKIEREKEVRSRR